MTQAQQMAKILESMLAKLKADKQHSDAAISILEKELWLGQSLKELGSSGTSLAFDFFKDF